MCNRVTGLIEWVERLDQRYASGAEYVQEVWTLDLGEWTSGKKDWLKTEAFWMS